MATSFFGWGGAYADYTATVNLNTKALDFVQLGGRGHPLSHLPAESGHQPFSLRPSQQAYGRRTLAYLFALPIQDAFDNIRNCPHCRENPEDRTFQAWEEARKWVRVMHMEAYRVAREVDQHSDAAGGASAYPNAI